MFFLTPDEIIRIALAVVAGGIIGLEREYRDKAAGFRTLIFICLGATLFTLFSVRLAGDKDPTRIAASIVSGVGFLGAGVILQEGRKVIGLTTASTIWLTAAIGMGIGGGAYPLVGVAMLAAMLTLWVFPRFESWMDKRFHTSSYQIVVSVGSEKAATLQKRLQSSGLKIFTFKQIRQGRLITCTCLASGSGQAHQALRAELLGDAEILEFQY